MQQVPGDLTTRIQQFECEADCSHPSSAKVTHVFSYTPSFNFMVWGSEHSDITFDCSLQSPHVFFLNWTNLQDLL